MDAVWSKLPDLATAAVCTSTILCATPYGMCVSSDVDLHRAKKYTTPLLLRVKVSGSVRWLQLKAQVIARAVRLTNRYCAASEIKNDPHISMRHGLNLPTSQVLYLCRPTVATGPYLPLPLPLPR